MIKNFYNLTAKPMLDILMSKGISREKSFYILSQMKQEQGYVPKYAKYNIYFNIKGQGPAGGLPFLTHEYINGERVAVTASFRMYNNMTESVDDYLSLLKRLYPQAYKSLFDDKATMQDFAYGMQHGIHGYSYATDPGYTKHLEDTYASITKEYQQNVKNESFSAGNNKGWFDLREMMRSNNIWNLLKSQRERNMYLRIANDAKGKGQKRVYEGYQQKVKDTDPHGQQFTW